MFKGHNVLAAMMQLALIFFLPTLLIAQSSRVTGELTGTISDNTGAVVPQATVTATDTATNQLRTAVSDDTGRFALHGLHDGVYSVRVRRGGFADAVRRQSQSPSEALPNSMSLSCQRRPPRKSR